MKSLVNWMLCSRKGRPFSYLLLFCWPLISVAGSTLIPAPETDPHYTEVGFFDIHVCNWPNQPLFFLALFSSYEHENLSKVQIFNPDNQLIGKLDFSKYRLIQAKGKPDKKVFINHIAIPAGAADGWYKSIATLRNGRRFAAEDYIVIRKMERAKILQPVDGAEDVILPTHFSWDPIPGAKFYQVFIRDIWDGKLVHESKLLSEPVLHLSAGLIKAGGYYSWRIHARDVNELA